MTESIASGKCLHDHLFVHGDGTWFVAKCDDCGLEGDQGKTPLDAYSAFNRSWGKRPKMQNGDEPQEFIDDIKKGLEGKDSSAVEDYLFE